MKHRAAFWLGAASAADYLVQMLLPALLVRTLAPAEFGGYRILWMAAQTGALVLSLNMAQNLVFLAPRQPLERRGALLCNVLAYLLVAGLLAAALAGPLLEAIGGTELGSTLPPWALPLFVGAWIVSLPYDQIGLVAGQPGVQARFTIVQTVLRVVVLGGMALATHSLAGVAAGMVALALARLALMLAYARASGAFGGWRLDAALGAQQWRYGVGFGLGGSLFLLRAQADGWITAARFDPAAVATISIALAIVPIIGVVRQSITSATVAEVARLFAAGDTAAGLRINRNANLSTALLVFPLIGAFCAVAPDAISLVYTSAYVAAALPARLYALAYVVCALEMSTVVQALGESRFVMMTGLVLLAVGVGTAWFGAGAWGLPGVALGSLSAMWLGSALNIQRVAARCGLPMRQLQPWREVSTLFVMAAAASLASAAVLAHVGTGSALLRVCAGGLLFIVIYGALAAAWSSTRQLYAGSWRRSRSSAARPVPSQS